MNKMDLIKVKRRAALYLSAFTCFIFIGFVSLIAFIPTIMSGPNFIFSGFILIIYNIILVSLYGRWSKRLYAQLDGGIE